jgi:hypothetical protein
MSPALPAGKRRFSAASAAARAWPGSREPLDVTSGTNTVTINAVDASGNAAEAVYEVDQAGTGKTFTYDDRQVEAQAGTAERQERPKHR